MVDYIYIFTNRIPSDMYKAVETAFNVNLQPSNYFYVLKNRGYVHASTKHYSSIIGRGSILAFLHDSPRTTVEELKEVLLLIQLDPSYLQNTLPEINTLMEK